MTQSNSGFNSTAKTFDGLGISPRLLVIVRKLGFHTPTPIQEQAIPIGIQGKDLVGVAQTGTGKTLAFGIPMIQRLGNAEMQDSIGIIVLPTRELALQADEVLRRLGRDLGLRTTVLIGGLALGPQVQALRRNPHIIVGTPGRIIDHLSQRTLDLQRAHIVVLDEADRMLDMGFAPQIKRIFEALPKLRQTMLFSATMPSEIMKIATSYMKLPVHVEIAPAGTTVERVMQEILIVPKEAKIRLLEKLLQESRTSTLVFTRTKYGAKKLTAAIYAMGHTVAEIHSNRSLAQRRAALEGFKSGRYRVLVATDIAARGIDVAGIGLVINYDLPSTAEDYVHRIGRTARGSAEGRAISFAMPDEQREVRSIERLIRKDIPVSQHPGFTVQEFSAAMPRSRTHPHHQYSRGRRSFGYPRFSRSSSGAHPRRGSR